ncbi:prepilin peptidase [Microvirga sp. M2]|uniref:A24 family peptidase n=1 Tax=Microvirga sp. M2 TaxID=3073270 RepID=UPI0039C36768
MIISTSVAFIGSTCLAAAAIWAGIMDLKTMKIRNEIVIFLFAAYAALAPLAGFNYGAIALSLLVALGVMVGLFLFFSLGWIGGGDAKLMAVIALWLGADQTPAYLISTTILGGLLTLGILTFRAMPLPAFLVEISWVARLHSFEKGIPYGVAIAAGALLILPQTPWMTGVF